nr:MAG TPA: hypothetical protein [Caudoviricetes sp.]
MLTDIALIILLEVEVVLLQKLGEDLFILHIRR